MLVSAKAHIAINLDNLSSFKVVCDARGVNINKCVCVCCVFLVKYKDSHGLEHRLKLTHWGGTAGGGFGSCSPYDT